MRVNHSTVGSTHHFTRLIRIILRDKSRFIFNRLVKWTPLHRTPTRVTHSTYSIQGLHIPNKIQNNYAQAKIRIDDAICDFQACDIKKPATTWLRLRSTFLSNFLK